MCRAANHHVSYLGREIPTPPHQAAKALSNHNNSDWRRKNYINQLMPKIIPTTLKSSFDCTVLKWCSNPFFSFRDFLGSSPRWQRKKKIPEVITEQFKIFMLLQRDIFNTIFLTISWLETCLQLLSLLEKFASCQVVACCFVSCNCITSV